MIECKLCKINNDDVQRLLAKNAIKLSIYLSTPSGPIYRA